MESILALCSRVIWLQYGNIRAEGPTEQVVRSYMANSLLESQSRQQISLRDRTDRDGNGQFRFTDLQLQNEAGEVVPAVMSGDTLNFVLGYEGEPNSLHNVSIRIWFIDDAGREILYFWTEYTGDDFETLPPSGEIICRAPRFPLAPGRYTIALRATVSGLRADLIQNAAVLEVTGNNFYGTGVKVPGHLSFLADHSWRLKEKSNLSETVSSSLKND